MKTPGVCQIMIVHLPTAHVNWLVEKFLPFCIAPSRLLLCYGGPEENFAGIDYPDKIFIADPRLRTNDHARQKQSYTEVFQKTAAWLKDKPELEYVYVGEYDQLPIVDDFHARLVERMEREGADVLAHELCRRDQTSCPYTLNQLTEPRFLPWLHQISRRQDKDVILVMLGAGSFWKRSAFLEVGRRAEPFPMYLELYLPTLAHHLGYRVRDFQEQSRYVSALGERSRQVEEARAAGAWSIHPVKIWPFPKS